ncbi:MAG: CvpA family protein [Candidatus Omnitrophota bacterium]|jgi:uncharacterized membrane protein required for colicin V production
MEDIYSWVEQVSRGLISRPFLMSFEWIDWLVVSMVLLGILAGMRKGLMREIVLVFEMFIITYILFEYYQTLAFYLESRIPFLGELYAGAVVYVVILFALMFAVRLIDALTRKWIQTTLVSPLRILGGATMGAVRVLLVLSLLSQVFLLVPLKTVQRVFEPGNSRFGYQVSKLAPDIHENIHLAVNLMTPQWKRLGE